MNETSLPTPEAVRHLNLDVIVTPSGKCISSKTRNRTVLDELISKGFLDPYHADYAFIYLSLRMAWLAPVSYKTSSLADEIRCWFDGSGISPANIYDMVHKILGKRDTNIIIWAMETDSRDIIAIEGEACHKCFERMTKAMDDVRTEFKKELA